MGPYAWSVTSFAVPGAISLDLAGTPRVRDVVAVRLIVAEQVLRIVRWSGPVLVQLPLEDVRVERMAEGPPTALKLFLGESVFRIDFRLPKRQPEGPLRVAVWTRELAAEFRARLRCNRLRISVGRVKRA